MQPFLTLLTALLLALLAVLHADDASSTQNADSPLMLAGDWVPEDPHQIDYEKLPRVKAEHTIISDVRDDAGTRVHQHAYLAHHDGRFWAMWSDGPGGPRTGVTAEQHRNIVPAHDMPGTRNSFATSKCKRRSKNVAPGGDRSAVRKRSAFTLIRSNSRFSGFRSEVGYLRIWNYGPKSAAVSSADS